MLKEYRIGKLYQGRLEKGDDLIEGLANVLRERSITRGAISGIGAVSEASIGFFNAATKEYEHLRLREDLEILSLQGNISYKDNAVYPLSTSFCPRETSRPMAAMSSPPPSSMLSNS